MFSSEMYFSFSFFHGWLNAHSIFHNLSVACILEMAINSHPIFSYRNCLDLSSDTVSIWEKHRSVQLSLIIFPLWEGMVCAKAFITPDKGYVFTMVVYTR